MNRTRIGRESDENQTRIGRESDEDFHCLHSLRTEIDESDENRTRNGREPDEKRARIKLKSPRHQQIIPHLRRRRYCIGDQASPKMNYQLLGTFDSPPATTQNMHLANTLEQNERRRGHNLYLTSRRHHESGDVISWMLQRACPNKHTLKDLVTGSRKQSTLKDLTFLLAFVVDSIETTSERRGHQWRIFNLVATALTDTLSEQLGRGVSSHLGVPRVSKRKCSIPGMMINQYQDSKRKN